jgi:hypothetical protein
MSTGGSADTADGYFGPRETAWFRTRLALRLAVPLDRRAQAAALRVTWSAALAAPPVTIALIAPAQKLTLGALSGLFCAGLPGFAATAWAAVGLRETRRLTARGLRQAGAEQRLAWLVAVARLALFATAGALVGGVFVVLSHAPLGAVLPRHSLLHGMFAAGAADWLLGITMTIALIVGGALLANSTVWERVDWSRLAFWRRVNRPIGEWLADVRSGFTRLDVRVPRRFRRPR